MENKNDRIKGIIAALIVFLLLFTLSLFLGFYYPDPPIPDVGVEIEMGGSGSSGGMQGIQEVASPEPRSTSQPSPATARSYVTDDTRDDHYTPPTTTPSRRPEETEVVQPETPQPTVNPDAMFRSRGTSSERGTGTSSGAAQGTGLGSTGGEGTSSGVGSGSGPSFSLVGRTARNLPIPKYQSDRQGNVVIDVHVDQQGNVIEARFNSRLSTTTDLNLRNAALEAARQSKFSVKLDAAVVQRGTITYKFYKLN